MKEKFPNSRKPSHRQVFGEFWNLRGQHNHVELMHTCTQAKEKTKTKNPQNAHLTATASGEVAQTLVLSTSKQGLDREA